MQHRKQTLRKDMMLKTDDDANGSVAYGVDEDAMSGCDNNNTDGSIKEEHGQAFRWSPESIYLMLKLRYERQDEFQQGLRQKKSLWNEIAEEMNRQHDYNITGDICDLKYRNMLQTFKKNRLKEKRGLQAQIAWEYYAIFKDAMKNSGELDDVEPSELCESICLNGEEEVKNLFEGVDVEIHPQNKRTRSSNHRGLAKRLHLMEDRISVEEEPEKKFNPNCLAPNRLNGEDEIPNPTALSDTNLLACRSFGESVGLQLATIDDPNTRALLTFKIQEQIYLAKVGKLTHK